MQRSRPACCPRSGLTGSLASMVLSLTGINRYPIKSCRGHSVPHAVVEPWGLAGDRRWMLVSDDGDVVTARQHPSLVLVSPEFQAGGLLVRAPDAEPLR